MAHDSQIELFDAFDAAAIEQKLGFKLRKRQIEAMQFLHTREFIEGKKNLLTVLDTGYGKTPIGMEAVDVTLNQGKRVLWISSLKALTGEQLETFDEMWPGEVFLLTGETKNVSYTLKALSKFNIFVLTFEKLESILMSKKNRTFFFDDMNVGSIIVDEIHNVGDESRGANLEAIIIMLRVLYPIVSIVGLSATIGNREKFATWLNARLVQTLQGERPIPLKLELRSHKSYYEQGDRDRMIIEYMNDHPDSKIIVFCSSRYRTQSLARKFASMRKVIPEKIYNDDLIDQLIDAGVCYHNASLTRTQRKKVEEAYKKDPNFKVLFSTPTLAQGVNLPVDICIIYDSLRYKWLQSVLELIKPNEFHQMLGRAGRPGISKMKFGLAVVFTPEEHYDEVEYICTHSSDVKSKISNDLGRKILEFVTTFARDTETLKEAFGMSLDPIEDAIFDEKKEWLIENGFLVEHKERGTIWATDLGRKTAYAFIQPETALHIIATNYEFENASIKDENTYLSLFDKLFNNEEFLENICVRSGNAVDRVAVNLASNVHPFLDERLAKSFSFVFANYIKVVKKMSTDELDKAMNERPILIELCQRFTRAAAMICDDNKKMYNNLGAMVKCGFIDIEIAKLMSINGIGDARVLHLIENHVRTVDDFLYADANDLAKYMRVKAETVLDMKKEARQIVIDTENVAESVD